MSRFYYYSLLLLTPCILLFSGCSKLFEPTSIYDKEEEENKDYIATRYKNGQLKTYVKIDSLSRAHGNAKKYREDGTLKNIIRYDKGIKTRAWQYYKNGNLAMDFRYENGIKHGVRKKYWKSGEIQSELTYHKGKQTNDLKEYKKNGELIDNYPKLILKINETLRKRNIIQIEAYFSDEKGRGSFYLAELKNGALPEDAFKLEEENDKGIHKIKIEPGTYISGTVNIVGKYRTRLGNFKLYNKSIQLNHQYL